MRRLVINQICNNDNQWKENHEVIETDVFDMIGMFSSHRRREC